MIFPLVVSLVSILHIVMVCVKKIYQIVVLRWHLSGIACNTCNKTRSHNGFTALSGTASDKVALSLWFYCVLVAHTYDAPVVLIMLSTLVIIAQMPALSTGKRI